MKQIYTVDEARQTMKTLRDIFDIARLSIRCIVWHMSF
jgi:hypothetical protein